MDIKNKQSGVSAHIGQAGVTLIELIVVIGIFGIVSSILLFNYSDFSTNVSIRNISQDIALSIRKAQTYATSVRGIDDNNLSTRTFPSYGLSFSLADNSGEYVPSNKKFILFADIPDNIGQNPNKKYDNSRNLCGNPETDSECLETFSINTSDKLVEICTDVSGCVSSGVVDITFRRPVPDAIICYRESLGDSCSSTSVSFVDVVLESSKGLRKRVSVWNTGQISIK